MNSSLPMVDVVVLTRDGNPVAGPVIDAIRRQRGINVVLHQVVGSPRSEDSHRVETIARARNSALNVGGSPWLMFVDDDVVLSNDCVARLHHAMLSRPNHAGFAADYLGDRSGAGTSPHVAMGATLIRRSVFRQTPFRWEIGKCECLCWTQDVRRVGLRIEYLPGVVARHLSKTVAEHRHHELPDLMAKVRPSCAVHSKDERTITELNKAAKVLVAFNRRDVRRFRDVFLRMLRSHGNDQQVIAVGYGLYPSECRLLSACRGVKVIHQSSNGQMPPVRRLKDFGEITAAFEPNTPVAYWDASDVIIQAKLDPLWRMTSEQPEKIFAVREPRGYPGNAAIVGWTRTIHDPASRDRAFELFSTRPFLNSGFSAGTAAAMSRYLTEAARLRESPELKGTTDWGDQAAFNLYCHSDPSRWTEVPESWNYCVHDRPVGEVQVQPDGRITCRSGTPIHVAHGNARSLAKLALVR